MFDSIDHWGYYPVYWGSESPMEHLIFFVTKSCKNPARFAERWMLSKALAPMWPKRQSDFSQENWPPKVGGPVVVIGQLVSKPHSVIFSIDIFPINNSYWMAMVVVGYDWDWKLSQCEAKVITDEADAFAPKISMPHLNLAIRKWRLARIEVLNDGFFEWGSSSHHGFEDWNGLTTWIIWE